MNEEDSKENPHGLPEMFRPLLWSYVFEQIDPSGPASAPAATPAPVASP